MRLIFMGTPEFSVTALNALIDAGHEIACVYTQPPRPAGRGKKDRPTPVHQRATELGLPVRHPTSLKTPEALAEFSDLNADLAVVVAYGLILPQAILDAPTKGCLNIHASLLPRWRGAAPIHRAIMAGDAKTGISIMQMDAGLDTGPVLLTRETEIASEETTAQLHDRLAVLGGQAITATLAQHDTLIPHPQPDDGVTYAEKIDKAEARIDWTRPAEEVDRQIRGLSPFPGAWFEYEGQRIKALASRRTKPTGQPGMVLDNTLTIACGSESVKLIQLQRAGKSTQDAQTFLRGFPIPLGTVL